MNPHDSGRFCTESIESAAKRYKTLGFSFIPLLGARNPQQPKLPAIKWVRFQHTHPSDADILSWFHSHNDIGIGIVCGRISRLIVLDFDDASVASEFRHLHPELANTFTVCSGTRGLPHFYYRIPENKMITTAAFPGADLRGEGAYVVAPPTSVNGMEWHVENDAPIHAISEFDLRRLMRFLVDLKDVSEQLDGGLTSDTLTSQASEFRHHLSEADLMTYYHQHTYLGRNHALFRASIIARDSGLSEAECCFVLAPIHAREPGVAHEDYRSRHCEAIRTITSAYKRPPRQPSGASHTGLSNAVREWLLCHKLTALARVLDGLYTVGVKPNDCFTELQACQKLAQLKIGRRSIMAALKVSILGKYVFESPLYPPEEAVAATRSVDLKNSCEMSRGAKRVKILKRGRPAQLYRLPTPKEVAEIIGVNANPGDKVAAEDFASPTTYRRALHKQLLKRRPAHYARAWLGDRLGVSRWTTRRYERAAQLYVKPAYITRKLTWSNAASLPQSKVDALYGTFLEASDGSRYPALRGLAFRLLKQDSQVLIKHQRPNYYAAVPEGVGIPTPYSQPIVKPSYTSRNDFSENTMSERAVSVGIPTSSTDDHPKCRFPKNVSNRAGVGIPTPQPHEQIFWLCPECLDFHVMTHRPDKCSSCGHHASWEIVPPTIWKDPQALKQWWQKRYRVDRRLESGNPQTLLDPKTSGLTAENHALAEQIHTEIFGMSFSNACKLVGQFEQHLIEKALRVIRERRNLRSPAGFLIAFLRSEQKLLSYNNKTGGQVKFKVKSESALEWVRALAKSQYLSFITNADDILNVGLSSELLRA